MVALACCRADRKDTGANKSSAVMKVRCVGVTVEVKATTAFAEASLM